MDWKDDEDDAECSGYSSPPYSCPVSNQYKNLLLSYLSEKDILKLLLSMYVCMYVG